MLKHGSAKLVFVKLECPQAAIQNNQTPIKHLSNNNVGILEQSLVLDSSIKILQVTMT